LAVNTADVATPDALETAVFTPLAKVPLAPEAGGVNVTVAFGTGFPPESFTRATSGLENTVLVPADCGVPLTAAIENGVPARLASEKVAAPGTPSTLAVTE
jgi:hypothetical protein